MSKQAVHTLPGIGLASYSHSKNKAVSIDDLDLQDISSEIALLSPNDHSLVVTPVPISNTEVKL